MDNAHDIEDVRLEKSSERDELWPYVRADNTGPEGALTLKAEQGFNIFVTN